MKTYPNNECNRMLKDIGIINFVMVELTLYLDTHPDDHEAMEYFQHYRLIYNRLCEDFSKRFYPLNLCTSTNTTTWSWAMEKVPWEGGF